MTLDRRISSTFAFLGAAGLGILGSAGCARWSRLAKPAVKPERVYVNLSRVMKTHPAMAQQAALRTYQKKLVDSASRLPLPAVGSPEIAPLQEDRRAPQKLVLQARQRASRVRAIRSRQQQELAFVLGEVQTNVNDRVNAKRAALESVNKARLLQRGEQIDQQFLAEVAQLPGRYATPATKLDLKLRAAKLTPEQREEMEAQRKSLQNEWRQKLADLEQKRADGLRQEQSELDAALSTSLESTRRELSTDAVEMIRRQRREINRDIASSQREWEAITFGEPTTGPRLEAQAPTPESVTEHVRGTRGNRFRHLNHNLSRELAGMQAYLEEDTKRQVQALAFKHRWTLSSRQQRQVPDRTQQVIDELRREAWNKMP